ncbi:formylglycine-generating enzyme family protein [Chloroflexi bacterium TSY]|nr:formylglycine-generating enzyme family protein [Chloroflexi bacterium TSY]
MTLTFDWKVIPAGKFLMGGDGRQLESLLPEDAGKFSDDEHLMEHSVYLTRYEMSRVPVTVSQFRTFVEETNYQTTAELEGFAHIWHPENLKQIDGASWHQPHGTESNTGEFEHHPVVSVSWHDAQAFCQWAGVRLPTEAEWEKAARGTDGRIFPWGNELPDANRCNFLMKIGGPTEVHRYPAGASPYDLLDMAGNVWEWTNSLSRSKFGVFGYFQSRLQGFWSHLFRFRLQKTTYFISENRPNLTQKLDIDRQICIYVNCLARILSQNLKFGSTESLG